MLPKLIGLYREAGLEPLTGYNSHHFGNYGDAPFTKFLRGPHLVAIAGLALQEVMLLEHFANYMSPRNILIIGNAYGWSTIALALIFPKAAVLAIDPGAEGNDVTNEIARKAGLSAVAALGYSPRDVGTLCAQHLSGPADLVLIDAVHDNPSVWNDFAACWAQSQASTIVLLHDVIQWNLVDAVRRIRAEHALEGRILTRTASGMAVLWKTAPQEFQDYVGVFTEDPNIFRGYRRLVLDSFVDKLSQPVNKL